MNYTMLEADVAKPDRYSFYYGRYVRHQMSWMWWRATFYKRWRRYLLSQNGPLKTS
jgi:hypothetical protein